MKAILSCEYGVENLQLRDIEKPTPKENEVLVRVRAASVNPADGHLIRGVWLMRPMLGMRKPPWGRLRANFASAFRSNFTSQKFVTYIAKLTKDDLNVLRDLMQSGEVAPVINRTYKMSETQTAVRYLEEGHAHGKIVITME